MRVENSAGPKQASFLHRKKPINLMDRKKALSSERAFFMREARSLPPLMKSAWNAYPRKGGRALIS